MGVRIPPDPPKALTGYIIEVPEANGMPLERWTAYMYCVACLRNLPSGTFSIGEIEGMSIIRIK